MAGAVAGPSRASPVPDSIDSRRTSGISGSAASYHTAFSDNSPSLSPMNLTASSGSVHTVGAAGKRADAQEANPMYLPSQGNQEVHVVNVEAESVELSAGTTPDSIVTRAGKTIARVVTTEPAVMAAGPPPPSPPPSFEREDDMSMTERSPSPKLGMSRSEPSQPQASSSTRSTRNRSFDASTAGGSNDILRQRSSTETRFSSRTVSGTGAVSIAPSLVRTVPTDEPSAPTTSERPPTVSTSGSPHLAHPSKTSHVSIDGHLQPPPSTSHRPARRNTTGSAAPIMSSLGSQAALHAHNPGHLSHHRGVAVDDTDVYTAAHSAAHAQMLGLTPGPDGTLGFGELDPDILIQADQIRRERTAKRRHQEQQEAEMAALNKAADEKRVLVGNLIGEDHVNYVLMYNMLTGIRIAVSRCQAKLKRPLTQEDFTARHKFSFDIVGNELTPSAKYDFKFKDYAPWVFRELRETHFGLDPADYLLSLTEKYILSELGSPGKSGSFFYFSRDYRFIIKTIHHTEHKFLRKILRDYYEHVKLNPHTLLSRFYGLHRVKLPRGRKIHFVIMNNLFPPHKDIHETYDLKGSTVGREYPEEKAQKNPRAVLKDLNWINRGKSLELGPEKRALLSEQLRRDSGLLKRLNVMDYSLLVGIHNMQRGNRDMVRKKTLKVFSPPPLPAVKRKPTSLKGSSPEAIAMRKAMRRSAPEGLGTSKALDLPEEDTGDRQQFIFYQDDGGLQATDEQNQAMDTIYYLGVIDILTPYTTLKRAEHIWKGLSADRHKISPVPPEEYGNRFFEFLTSVMRGGGGAEKFKPE